LPVTRQSDFSLQSTSDELVVGGIGRDAGDWNWIEKLATRTKRVEQGIDIPRRESKARPKEDVGIFFEDFT
jgi:hypothetical protein